MVSYLVITVENLGLVSVVGTTAIYVTRHAKYDSRTGFTADMQPITTKNLMSFSTPSKPEFLVKDVRNTDEKTKASRLTLQAPYTHGLEAQLPEPPEIALHPV